MKEYVVQDKEGKERLRTTSQAEAEGFAAMDDSLQIVVEKATGQRLTQ